LGVDGPGGWGVGAPGAWRGVGGGWGGGILFGALDCAAKGMGVHPGQGDAERAPVQGLWSPAPRGG